MNINDYHVYPLEYSNSLTFSDFPAFLEWAASNWDSCPASGEDEFLYWTGLYSTFLSTPYMANLGAILTLLADCFLEYDRTRGVITNEEKAWWFDVWQGKILSELARRDLFYIRKKAFMSQSQDVITVTKTFNV